MESYPRRIELVQGVEVRPIERAERGLWDALMRRRHYLGFCGMAGETMRHVAVFQGRWLALVGWGAAALKCKVRDQWIGWFGALQWQRLPLVANNCRFLMLPEVPVPHLASRILALSCKRLSQDWQAQYGHPLYLVESFVDPRYFKGTCYRAAGWVFLGYTRGFGKHARSYIAHGNPKMVFVRHLRRDARQKLADPVRKLPLPREVKPMRVSEKHAEELINRLREIPDPRKARGIRHRKIAVLAMAICAILSNARSFAAIAEWAARCSQSMLRRLGCRYDKKTSKYIAPSEPTIRRLLQSVDAQAVDRALYGWLLTLGGSDSAVAVDGKTLRGARQKNGKGLHLLTAFLHQHGMVLAQHQVPTKSNEIPALRPLMDPLDVKGRVVTLDALHTHSQTAQYLVEDKGADYLFTVKDNQRLLKKDIQDLGMMDFPPSAPQHR